MIAVTAGSRYQAVNSASSAPSTLTTARIERMARLPASVRVEQALHGIDLAAIRQEHDDVVFGLDPRVMVRDDHFLATRQCDDRDAMREVQLLDAPAHDARAVLRPVHDGLQRLRRALPQRVHAYHVAAPH